MKFPKNPLKLAFVAIFYFFVFLPFSCKAVETETVGIFPANPDPNVMFSDSWFIYKLDLGENKLDAARIINKKPETVVVKLYAVDAITTPDGSFALLQENNEKKDVGNWIKLAANEVELPPNSEKTVPFRIEIPKNADAGDHMGGIIMQEVETEGAVLSGTGVRIVTRVGVRIYETVPGEVKKDYEITRYNYRVEPSGDKNWIKDILDINKRTIFMIGIKNKGNVKIYPKVTLEVKNIFGRTVANISDKEVGVVFPRGENGESTIFWGKSPFFGRYKAKATVNFPEQGLESQSKEIVIWAVPYRTILLIVVILVIIVLLNLVKKYMRESSKEKMAIYQVNPGDTIGKLAGVFSVNWKRLAIVNEIQKPFEVRVGEKLFIPMNKRNRQTIEEMKKSGRLMPSIIERSGLSQKTKKSKRLAIIAVLILIGLAAVWGIWLRKNKKVHEEFKLPQEQKEEAKETAEKTKAGAFKKSSINITVSSGNSESNNRLLKKLKLIGYNAMISSQSGSYSKTTIECKLGKKEQAEMVKNDLGVAGEVEIIEKSDLTSDVSIFNLEPKEDFLDI